MGVWTKLVLAASSGSLVLAVAAQATAQSAPVTVDGAMPDGPDRALVTKTCTACHVASQVTAQRKTKDQWAATVDQMIGYGAQVSDDDYPKIVDYLSAHFGAGTGSAPPKS